MVAKKVSPETAGDIDNVLRAHPDAKVLELGLHWRYEVSDSYVHDRKVELLASGDIPAEYVRKGRIIVPESTYDRIAAARGDLRIKPPNYKPKPFPFKCDFCEKKKYKTQLGLQKHIGKYHQDQTNASKEDKEVFAHAGVPVSEEHQDLMPHKDLLDSLADFGMTENQADNLMMVNTTVSLSKAEKLGRALKEFQPVWKDL